MNPAEVGNYALTTRNAWGPLGWRRDQWGATDNYLNLILKNNEKSFGTASSFKNDCLAFYHLADNGRTASLCKCRGSCPYWNLEKQISEYERRRFGMVTGEQ